MVALHAREKNVSSYFFALTGALGTTISVCPLSDNLSRSVNLHRSGSEHQAELSGRSPKYFVLFHLKKDSMMESFHCLIVV